MSNTPMFDHPSAQVELGRYELPDCQRVLVGQRIDGIVHVTDWPARGRGRRYPVEAGFESFAELAVLIADYRRRANALGCCPMSREAISRTLDGVAAGADPSPASHALAGARGGRDSAPQPAGPSLKGRPCPSPPPLLPSVPAPSAAS